MHVSREKKEVQKGACVNTRTAVLQRLLLERKGVSAVLCSRGRSRHECCLLCRFAALVRFALAKHSRCTATFLLHNHTVAVGASKSDFFFPLGWPPLVSQRALLKYIVPSPCQHMQWSLRHEKWTGQNAMNRVRNCVGNGVKRTARARAFDSAAWFRVWTRGCGRKQIPSFWHFSAAGGFFASFSALQTDRRAVPRRRRAANGHTRTARCVPFKRATCFRDWTRGCGRIRILR